MSRYRFSRTPVNLALTHGGAATTANTPVALNGLLSEIIILAPATVDGGATLTIDIIDSDACTVYTKPGVAAAAKSINLLTGDLKVPLCDTYTVKVTFSAAQTATDTVTGVRLLIDKGA